MLTQNNKKMRKKKQLIKWNTISTKYPYMTIAVVAMHTWHYSNSEDERIKNDEKVSSLVRNVIMLINFPLARMHSPHMLLAHVCVIESTIYGIPIAQFKLRQRVCFFSFSHSLYICYADGSVCLSIGRTSLSNKIFRHRQNKSKTTHRKNPQYCDICAHRFHDEEHANLLNSMWLIAITFLSVGFGDVCY